MTPPDGNRNTPPPKPPFRPVSWLLGDLVEVVTARTGHNLSRFLGDRQPLVWLLGLLVGVTAAYASVGFRYLLGAVQWVWLGSSSELTLSVATAAPWWLVLCGPALGGLVMGLLLMGLMPARRTFGVADVIEARALHECHIPLRTGLLSALLSAFSLGCGASAGREGPIVHLGATIGSQIERLFQLSPGSRRTLFAAGCAAAVAASFNAPIAGVLFAHEVILAHYALRAFVPIVISSVAATIISRIHLGDSPAFVIPTYAITSFLEFPAFALLGVTCAVVAVLLEVSLIATDRIVWRFEMPLWLRTTLGGLAVGAIGVFFPQVLGVGYESTDQALYQQLPIWLLLTLIVAKTAATAITLATRFGSGIFSPCIYLGAMTGSAFGLIAASLYPEMGSSQGLYAILGMGGVASAVLGAPISTTLIVFELTRGVDITIALLLTIAISNGLTYAMLGGSYFHWQLARRGFLLQEGPHREILQTIRVARFMQPDTEQDGSTPAPLDAEQPLLRQTDTLEQALRTFDAHGLPRIAVVDSEAPHRVLGWATRLDALDVYNRALVASHEEEHQ